MVVYGKFDPKRLSGSIEKAVIFWQERLALQHWYVDKPKVRAENTGFSVTHHRGYLVADLYYPAPDADGWERRSNEWVARGLGHELVHLFLARLLDPIERNLDGSWLEDARDGEDATADHIITAIWRLLSPKDRAYLTALFAEARLK